jgi:hypothetical protein
MTRSAPLTRTLYAWAVVSIRGQFIPADDHPCGIVTFATRKEAASKYSATLGFTPVEIQITVKLAKVAK